MTTRVLALRADKISEQVRKLNRLKDEASKVEVVLANGREHFILDTDIVSMQSIEANWSTVVPTGTTRWADTSGTMYTYNQTEFTDLLNEIVELRAERAVAATEKYTDTVPLLPLPDDDPVFSLSDWYT